MSSAKRLHYEYADYLRSLEMSELKLEYCDGVIYAMAGGTRAHAQLSSHRRAPSGPSEELPSVDFGLEGAGGGLRPQHLPGCVGHLR